MALDERGRRKGAFSKPFSLSVGHDVVKIFREGDKTSFAKLAKHTFFLHTDNSPLFLVN